MRNVLLVIPMMFLAGCWFGDDREVLQLSGETMGTTYNVTVIGSDMDEDALSVAIEETLKSVNASMSNWDPNSEVSLFSASADTTPMQASQEFVTVIAAANTVHETSGGKFDVTLGPLIELWGFGPRTPESAIPSDTEIAAALAQVGQARLLTLDETALTVAKFDPAVGINLSAIAKGYGVDAVATALQGFGITNYMVEIGGDLVTSGKNDQDQSWRIGIEKPDASAQSVQLIVPVSNYGLATSGDYRNFFEQDGIRYSHILDVTTGRPITHRTTSVTVVAETAMMADAWATAMLVLGRDAGLALAEAEDIAVFFISRDETGAEDAYIVSESSRFTEIQQAE
jgi:thiamine biosynthesis lipoprotein